MALIERVTQSTTLLFPKKKRRKEKEKKNSFRKFLVIVDVSQSIGYFLTYFENMTSMKDAQLILTDIRCTTDIQQDLSRFHSADVINF